VLSRTASLALFAPTYDPRQAARGGPRSPIDALGPDPVMVEEDGQGSAVDLQRPRRDGRHQADVPLVRLS